jgi:hypothetical protein
MLCDAETIYDPNGNIGWQYAVITDNYHVVVRGCNSIGADWVFEHFDSLYEIYTLAPQQQYTERMYELFFKAQPDKRDECNDPILAAELGFERLADWCIDDPDDYSYVLLGAIYGHHISLIEKYLVQPYLIHDMLQELLADNRLPEIDIFLPIAVAKYPNDVITLYDRIHTYMGRGNMEIAEMLRPYVNKLNIQDV